ncbi:DUF2304 domain-containing protein [Actinomycetaceae bacterium TAE3-ERU4]|nr:DUF2304 domain-containing protein [Actinomycetaceae bacterium TAE3-ERU4]
MINLFSAVPSQALLPEHTIIKWLLGIGLTLILIFTLRIRPGQRTLAMRRLFLLGFLIFAFVAVLWPSFITKIANLVGVGRGADLLLYLLIIFFFANLASSYRRRADIDNRITELARSVALQNVQYPLDKEKVDVPETSSSSDSSLL